MLIRIVILTLLSALNLAAQNGDKKDSPGEKQVERVPRSKIPPSPVLTPEKALKSFKVQPGFRVEVVASEPLVQDPVAMAFDAAGRIWVAEMTGYMRDYDATGEREPTGTIAVLEDTNGDGKMDKRTLFLDKLTMPRAVMPVRDGVLVAEPPFLWFCRDKDGDLKCDEKKEIARDYGDTKNPEHTANSPTWALDNWIYSANWTFRFRSLPDDEWKREPTTFRGQWGLAQDDSGRLVYNSNSDQFRMDRVPSHYLQRNPHYRNPLGVNFDPIGNQAVYPVRVTPGVNRGYREGVLRPDGTLRTFTAACSPLIYRGENFPREFYGNAFVCEPSANLIKRNVLQERGLQLTGWQAYTNAEFIASRDERFRPVNLNNGLDGCLYIVDLYRGVIQHKIFLTSYLRNQSEQRKLEAPIGYGRIYRVVATGRKPGPTVRLDDATTAELVKHLANPNGWVRDTAQRLLVERNDTSIVGELKKVVTENRTELAPIHALWTLDTLGQIDQQTLFAAFQSPNAKLRVAAIRMAEPFLKSEDAGDFLDRFATMAEKDGLPEVQLQLAYTLGEIVDPTAEKAMVSVAQKSCIHAIVRDALLTGLYRRELEFLEKLLTNSAWTQKAEGREELISNLAQAVFREGRTNRVDRLFDLAASIGAWQRQGIVNGVIAGAPAAKAKNAPAPKLLRFAKEPAGYTNLKKKSIKAVETITRLITWPGRPGYVPPPVVRALTTEEQAVFEVGRDLFATTCAACHQLTGLGMEGLAPPLAESEWVLGPEERLARIALHGVRGPISVRGKTYDMEMPGLGESLNDEQIAAVLTFIRREWDHGADPVSRNTVGRIRNYTGKRAEAWSEAELLKIGASKPKSE